MSETGDSQAQSFNQWIDWQQKFWKDWMDNANKGVEQVMSMWQTDGSKSFPVNETITISTTAQAFEDDTYGASIMVSVFPYVPAS